LQIQKRQEKCKTLSATPLVHPRDHYFLIRNLLRKIPKRRRRRKTLLYCRNHRCEGLWTKVLLWLPETDSEYCNDNITLKEPEFLKGTRPKTQGACASKNVCTKLQKAEKTLKKSQNDRESIFQYSKPKKNEKVYRDYETTGEKITFPHRGEKRQEQSREEVL
jgi:hypothetical protein